MLDITTESENQARGGLAHAKKVFMAPAVWQDSSCH